jgi:hypothetical protein
MKYLNWRILVFFVLATGILVVSSASVEAQCAMCRAVLSGSNNARFMRNFNIGVLVLLVPPVSIFCSFFIVLRHHRGERTSSDPNTPES